MARTKAYMKFETKEDFEKTYRDIYDSGKEDGFENGLAVVLSLLLDVRDELVDYDENVVTKAEYMQKQRHSREFKQRQKLHDAIRKQAVVDYLKAGEKGD